MIFISALVLIYIFYDSGSQKENQLLQLLQEGCNKLIEMSISSIALVLFSILQSKTKSLSSLSFSYLLLHVMNVRTKYITGQDEMKKY